jgi:hypothetical protein
MNNAAGRIDFLAVCFRLRTAFSTTMAQKGTNFASVCVCVKHVEADSTPERDLSTTVHSLTGHNRITTVGSSGVQLAT